MFISIFFYVEKKPKTEMTVVLDIRIALYNLSKNMGTDFEVLLIHYTLAYKCILIVEKSVPATEVTS